MSKTDHRVNHEIDSARVLLVRDSGEPSIFTLSDAMDIAREEGLDLVEVGAGDPPVVKLMNYGKFKFQQQKAQKKPKAPKMKEIRFKPHIQDRDLQVKINQAIRLLRSGHKIKVTLVFAGREVSHAEDAEEKMDTFSNALTQYAELDSELNMDGNSMSMTFVPVKFG